MSLLIKEFVPEGKKNGEVVIFYPNNTAVAEPNREKVSVTYQTEDIPPHGRCIDADALVETLKCIDIDGAADVKELLTKIERCIASAPTVLSADGAEQKGTVCYAPCKKGDTVYLCYPKRPIEALTVKNVCDPIIYLSGSDGSPAIQISPKDFGTYFFLSREDAEAAAAKDAAKVV